MESEDISSIRELISQRLIELREEILGAADSTNTVELDQQSIGRLSRMDALQQQAMAIALEQRRQREIARLQNALARLDDDEFGYCEDFGEDIPKKRLEIDPATTRCVSCASG